MPAREPLPPPLGGPAALGEIEKAGEKTGVPSDTQVVIKRYLAGDLVEEMAKERGITKKALYKRMHKFMLASSGEDGYSDLITQALADRISVTDDELESSESMLEVAKWSQLGKFARMDFERKRPALYGQKPIQVNLNPLVMDRQLAASMQTLLDKVVPQEKVIYADAG